MPDSRISQIGDRKVMYHVAKTMQSEVFHDWRQPGDYLELVDDRKFLYIWWGGGSYQRIDRPKVEDSDYLKVLPLTEEEHWIERVVNKIW